MEDVKEHNIKFTDSELKECFNPCFNGRCKRTTSQIKLLMLIQKDSILVLMEDVKEQNYILLEINNGKQVSILVLMEDVKEHII